MLNYSKVFLFFLSFLFPILHPRRLDHDVILRMKSHDFFHFNHKLSFFISFFNLILILILIFNFFFDKKIDFFSFFSLFFFSLLPSQ